MRSAGEPRFSLWGFVGGMIIHDDMDIESFRDLSIDFFEEVQEFGRPVTLIAFADDNLCGDIERGKPLGTTMPHEGSASVRILIGVGMSAKNVKIMG